MLQIGTCHSVHLTMKDMSLNSTELKTGTYSSMAILEGISDQRRAYLTGVTCSWGSRSTCMCSIMRQKEARRSKGRSSSDMQRRIRSTSSWPEILLMARYWRSRHMRANRFSWYLRTTTQQQVQLVPEDHNNRFSWYLRTTTTG